MSGEHILLFENEKGLIRIMTLLLRQAGMRVTTFDRAGRAIEIIDTARAENDEVIIVIIDVSSPSPEGYKLQRMVQGQGGQPPTIVIAQYGDEKYLGVTRDGSNLSLLFAPFEPSELFSSIKKATFQADRRKVAS